MLQVYTRVATAPAHTQRLIEQKLFLLIERNATHDMGMATMIRWAGFIVHIGQSPFYSALEIEHNITKILTVISNMIHHWRQISPAKTCMLMRACTQAPALTTEAQTLVTTIVNSALDTLEDNRS